MDAVGEEELEDGGDERVDGVSLGRERREHAHESVGGGEERAERGGRERGVDDEARALRVADVDERGEAEARVGGERAAHGRVGVGVVRVSCTRPPASGAGASGGGRVGGTWCTLSFFLVPPPAAAVAGPSGVSINLPSPLVLALPVQPFSQSLSLSLFLEKIHPRHVFQ